MLVPWIAAVVYVKDNYSAQKRYYCNRHFYACWEVLAWNVTTVWEYFTVAREHN